MRGLLSFDTVPAIEADSREAMRLVQAQPMQYFDALLIATCVRAGCSVFFSEDLQDGRSFGSMVVRNPFVLTETELEQLIS